MSATTNLGLPYIFAAQAQKHVTHNEALRTLDALVQISVLDRDLLSPPAAPVNGNRYIIASGATGDWAGNDGQIGAFQDGAWIYYLPREGWLAWIADENRIVVYDGSNWATNEQNGLGSTTAILNATANDGETHMLVAEEELTLSGASVDSTIAIPDRAIVFAVSTLTTEAITGATSFDCGTASETNKYGGTLGIAVGSTNSGVTGPTAYYADTPVRITSNGGNFAGGKVRLVIHYMLCIAPTS